VAEVKPHIKLVYGIWHCGIKGIPNRYLGIGDTPSAAYRDWVCHG
jgi:predicted alpha/beta hydrolase